MAELTNNKKKELAFQFYMNTQYTVVEIAEKLELARQTVSRWAEKGKWKELKAANTVTNEQNISRLREQINHILTAISDREEGKRIATAQEADTLNKLGAAIQKLEREVGLTDIINVGTRFITWLRQHDLNKAKEFIELWDLFIKEQIR